MGQELSGERGRGPSQGTVDTYISNSYVYAYNITLSLFFLISFMFY